MTYQGADSFVSACGLGGAAEKVWAAPPRLRRGARNERSQPAEVLKVLWTSRYWMGEEIKSVEKWGFGTTTTSPDVVLVES